MTLPAEYLGCVPYEPTWQAMRAFTQARDAATPDALWLCEHPPVFTLGVAGDAAHVLAPGDVPVVRTDRGGQVTYHGPGQVVAYPLLDLRRAGLYVKAYVFRLEEAAIRTLAEFGVVGHRVRGAPGLYVRPQAPGAHARLPEGFSAAQLGDGCGLAKIAALGIKVRGHCAYHGLALNVAMDLAPYARIHPCGYAGLPSTDLASLGVTAGWAEVAQALARHLTALLGENGT